MSFSLQVLSKLVGSIREVITKRLIKDPSLWLFSELARYDIATIDTKRRRNCFFWYKILTYQCHQPHSISRRRRRTRGPCRAAGTRVGTAPASATSAAPLTPRMMWTRASKRPARTPDYPSLLACLKLANIIGLSHFTIQTLLKSSAKVFWTHDEHEWSMVDAPYAMVVVRQRYNKKWYYYCLVMSTT